MIKLFISDIDGCLAEPYQPYDLVGFEILRRFAAADTEEMIPALSLCSGRSYAYVEAMTQALALRTPVLFESGGGLFDPVAARLTWNPAFTDEIDHQLQAIRRFMVEACLPGTSLSLDYGKRTQAGLVGPLEQDVMDVLPAVKAFVETEQMNLNVFFTPYSIDVVAPTLTKKQALSWLGDHLGFSLEEMAFIGDTDGDLGAIQAVGYGFAPANADEAIRKQVPHVTTGHFAEGVIEAYQWCIHHNESCLALAS